MLIFKLLEVVSASNEATSNNTAKIANIISIIALFVSVFFALPPFIKMCVDHCQGIEYKLIGCDIHDNSTPVLYLQIINRSTYPNSIVDICVNSKKTLVKKEKDLKSPKCIFINGNDNIIIGVFCPYLTYEEPINIEIFTTKKKKPYKLELPCYFELHKII